VPWTRPLGLSAMNRAPLDRQEEDGIVTLECQEEWFVWPEAPRFPSFRDTICTWQTG
jgi:hypothetical protein